MKKEMRAKLYEAYKKIYSRCDDCDDMAMYCTGKTLMCFELRGKLVPIEKCNIETQFPFGYDYPLGNRTMENAFALSRLARTSECSCVADWTQFVTDNLELFKEIANDMWRKEAIPNDEDDLIYEWIRELDNWLTGYVSETEYRTFMDKYSNRIKEVA